jgi:hypothetical protein
MTADDPKQTLHQMEDKLVELEHQIEDARRRAEDDHILHDRPEPSYVDPDADGEIENAAPPDQP